MKEGITLEAIRRSGVFNNMDLELGRYVSGGKPENGPIRFLAGALASWAVQQGHSCCDLKQLAGQVLNGDDEGEKQLSLPALEDFRAALMQAPETAAVLPDQTIGKKPLILDPAGRLYLNRYYYYEKNVAGHLAKRRNLNRLGGTDWNSLPEIPRGKIAEISELFRTASATDGEPDWQQAAVFLAHARNFAIITGGPGTGKTTVMTTLLAWELEDNPEIRIALCAPTGKAVNRMKSAIAEELPKIHCPDRVRELLAHLPGCCTTVDSLLHPIPHTTKFRLGKNQPVEADLVILDEVSMSSLSQLSHLFDALRDKTRLVLIGDKDQLTSVEAGSVLGDLIGAASLNVMPPELSARFEQITGWKIPEVSDDRPLSGTVIELQKNYRAKNAPEICAVSSGIKRLPDGGDPAALCLDIMNRKSNEFHSYGKPLEEKTLKKELTAFLAPAREMIRLASSGEEKDLIEAFGKMESFRILCAIHSGLTGVENINRMAADILNLRSVHSIGMPLIVLENTPMLGLSNGDVGLVWLPKNSGQTVVAFPGVDQSFKIVRFAEMPPFEQVFAMTVHKSQGSGFDNVMILLPPKDVPVLTRELIYTAVTRAKKSVRLYASEEILKKTLGTATVRYSGMANQLKEFETNEP